MQPESVLTKVQRNELYESVREGGLDLTKCDLIENFRPADRVVLLPERRFLKVFHQRETALEYPDSRTAQIKHLPSDSAFTVDIRLYESYSYTTRIAGEDRSSDPVVSWRGIREGARKWAEIVKRECVDPDLWMELRRAREFLAKTQHQESNNTPFTPDERAEIAEQLQEIKEYVKRTYSLSVEQAAYVDARLDEAEDASQRLGRKDWILLFGGALFSLLLAAVVPAEAVQHILNMAAQGLGHLFGREPPPGLSP